MMDCSWETCSSEVNGFVFYKLDGIKEVIKDECIGFYLHGSLAMGGFNPNSSDIDVLAVTKNALSIENKKNVGEVASNVFKSSIPY